MNPFSFLAKVNPLRMFSGYFERHPWQKRLLILAPFLLLLALLNPVLGAVDKLFGLVGKALGPLLETGLGRAILLVVLLLLVAIGFYAFAKERVLNIFRRYAVALHLRAMESILLGHAERAVRDLRRVIRLGRWFDLSKGPAAKHGSLAIDARIKLARIALERENVKKARAELARIPKSQLKKRLLLSYAELNARVFAEHPDHLPASVLQELAASHKTWPAHPGIAEVYADKLIASGESTRAAEVLTETMRRTSKNHAPRIASRLARLNLQLAEEALHAGHAQEAGKFVERSLRLEESERALLLKADVHLAKGQLDAALSVLGALESPAAKERVARLLRHEAQPLAPRQLLAHMPRQESLLALAEWYMECGELRRAARALEVCRRHGFTNPRVLALLACVRLQERAPAEASKVLRLALTSLGAQPSPSD